MDIRDYIEKHIKEYTNTTDLIAALQKEFALAGPMADAYVTDYIQSLEAPIVSSELDHA